MADFFEVYAEELPLTQAGIAREIYSNLFKEHARTRFSGLFKLSTTQVDAVIATAGGGDGWRETIEELAGFSFRKPSAPESAELYSLITKSSVRTSEKDELAKKGRNTLSAVLAADDTLMDETLDDDVFSCITTVDPRNNPISEPEVEKFTDLVLRQTRDSFCCAVGHCVFRQLLWSHMQPSARPCSPLRFLALPASDFV